MKMVTLIIKGWKLYLPGDEINNLKVYPFPEANSCQKIEEEQALQESPDVYSYIEYKGKRKLKIKCCSYYDLKYLFENLLHFFSLI